MLDVGVRVLNPEPVARRCWRCPAGARHARVAVDPQLPPAAPQLLGSAGNADLVIGWQQRGAGQDSNRQGGPRGGQAALEPEWLRLVSRRGTRKKETGGEEGGGGKEEEEEEKRGAGGRVRLVVVARASWMSYAKRQGVQEG
ncbi:unnamed protein product [Prorocentrum cordatum]|uniref:Uncharacterized protein n=1 Tax=Prorocentrum cordatum TaxID=2364126 RepID=A0ABN9QKB4_9DINO|nr:unnamed protein product [Polarella glacialis]